MADHRNTHWDHFLYTRDMQYNTIIIHNNDIPGIHCTPPLQKLKSTSTKYTQHITHKTAQFTCMHICLELDAEDNDGLQVIRWTKRWVHLGLNPSQGEEVVLDSRQNSTLIPVVECLLHSLAVTSNTQVQVMFPQLPSVHLYQVSQRTESLYYEVVLVLEHS